MKVFHVFATFLAVVFSVTFAILLFPRIVGIHGVSRSAFFVALGIGVIWLFYFMLGHLFGRIYDAGKEKGSEDNSDFV